MIRVIFHPSVKIRPGVKMPNAEQSLMPLSVYEDNRNKNELQRGLETAVFIMTLLPLPLDNGTDG